MAPHDLFPPLPFVTSLEGIGGCIKASASDFCVTEVGDPSEPCADGKHAHVTLTRSDLNTRDVQQRLAKLFSVQVDEIGVAGLKDRTARVTQTFSLPRERLPKELRTTESTAQIAAMLRESAGANGWVAPAEEPSWHRSKLKKGHLVGNRFEIIISQCAVPPEVAVARAHAIADELRSRGGWPNYYGPQACCKPDCA